MESMDSKASTLKSFAEYVDQVNRTKTDVENMKINVEEVEAVNTLLESYQVRIPSEDLVLLDDLRQVCEEFGDKLVDTERDIHGRLPHNRELVDKSIAKVTQELIHVKDALDKGVLGKKYINI